MEIEGEATTTETMERIHSSQTEVQFHERSEHLNVTWLFLQGFKNLRAELSTCSEDLMPHFITIFRLQK